MYAWFTKYSYNYENVLKNPNNELENGKLDCKNKYGFENELLYVKYPYGVVD